MKVLYAASEAYPLVKTGGLADVASGLPAALAALGCDVRTILPAYAEALDRAEAPGKGKGKAVDLGDPLGLGGTRLIPARMPDSGIHVWLVDCPTLYKRRGGPYADAKGNAWPDNHLRFALLSMAAALVCRDGVKGWRPGVVHANDWHTGLVPLYLSRLGGVPVPSVFTIHNIHYQGLFEPKILKSVGLKDSDFTIDGVEYYAMVSFIKAGLQFSDRITTVSPSYAVEIQGPEMGEGLDGLLRARAGVLSGILNGVDYGLWNPAKDKAIARNYSPQSLERKAENKPALQRRMGLEVTDQAPLLGMVSRFTHQKGIDIALDAVEGLFGLGAQVAVLGSGEARYERAIKKSAAASKGRMAAVIGYDEDLSHLIQAGADMVLVPSRFEPCGLTQLYALRYGTLPVVRRTGGLADSVFDVSGGKAGTGFVFDGADPDSLLQAV
ncbi:MAG: glycogen synthase GlgA, partial [Rhodospirillales bacterium]